jgi:hypothetical protein
VIPGVVYLARGRDDPRWHFEGQCMDVARMAVCPLTFTFPWTFPSPNNADPTNQFKASVRKIVVVAKFTFELPLKLDR